MFWFRQTRRERFVLHFRGARWVSFHINQHYSCISKNNMPHCHFSLGLSMCPGDRQTPGRQFQWAEHSIVAGSVYYAKSLFLTSFHIIITSVAFPSLTFSIDQRTQLKSNTLFMWVWPLPIKGFFSLQFFPLFFASVFQYYCLLSFSGQT